MKILVTGANGFLGHFLIPALLNEGYKVMATGRGASRLSIPENILFHYLEMDFTDHFQVHDVFEAFVPDVVIHAGALSKPDECEMEQWKAFQVNVEGTLTLLLNAASFKSFFLFLSTDFVFDGKTGPYKEEDPVAPVNYYGQTKAEAEEAVREYEYEWAIIRTVLVYGPAAGERGNLLTVVKEKLEKGEPYNVFTDQHRTPTFVGDLVKGILLIIQKRTVGNWHIAGSDRLTTYEMAIETARFLGLDDSLILPITRDDWQQPAERPRRTGLSIEKAIRELGYDPLSFKDGLIKTFTS